MSRENKLTYLSAHSSLTAEAKASPYSKNLKLEKCRNDTEVFSAVNENKQRLKLASSSSSFPLCSLSGGCYCHLLKQTVKIHTQKNKQKNTIKYQLFFHVSQLVTTHNKRLFNNSGGSSGGVSLLI